MADEQEHFLVDIKHEIVLHFGDVQSLENHREAIIDGCRAYGGKVAEEAEDVLRIVKAGELDAWSIQYMKDTRRVPRRIVMRLQNQAGVQSRPVSSSSSPPSSSECTSER